MYPTLQNLKSEANIERSTQPYMYDFFKVIPLYMSSNGSADGSLQRIYNAVVEGLNEHVRLPRYVLFFPDCDLIVHTNYFTYGVKTILQDEIDWLMKQVDRALIARRESLKSKILGAAGKIPKLIWVKMIPRPYVNGHPVSCFNNTISLHNKFNEILDVAVKAMQNSSTMEILPSIFEDQYNFDKLA